jgi:alpha-mannosidase
MKGIMRSAKIRIFLLWMMTAFSLQAQQAWFADGYHGGIYGHYPMWQAQFMVDQLKANPGWAINLEIEPETWDSISIQDADNFAALQRYYETEGRFGRIEFVNPAWAQPYAYNISGESLIRQFAYGMDKIREYFPSATFHTYSVEEPCFTSSLPQILKGFGFSYAVLRNPNTCWGGYTSAFGKDLVNWIGPDGSSIPAVPRYAIEGLSEESTWQTDSWTNSRQFIERCFQDGIQYPIGMCFQDAGWDGGPWHNEYQPTAYTTWTDYIENIREKVEADDWRFTQEDVKPGLVWGAQVLQKIAQQVRVSENRLIMAEKMAALDFLFHSRPWPEADLGEAWRTLMLAQHHDCWIVPYNGKPGDTWADNVSSWTHSSNRIADEIIASQSPEGRDSSYLRIYNTLGSTRREQLSLVLPDDWRECGVTVMDAQGRLIPSQLSGDSNGARVLHFEAEVPAMGYVTFMLKKATSDEPVKSETNRDTDEELKIETDYYVAHFDPMRGGTITSLIDKMNGATELVMSGRSLNNLKGFFYREGRFHEGAESPAVVSLVEEGPLFTRVKVENQIDGNRYRQFVTFHENHPRIDFELQIDWEGQPGIGAYDQSDNYRATDRNKAFYNDQYKLHVAFPLDKVGERLYKNAPFDVCETTLDNTLFSRWDSLKHNVILNWVDLTDQGGERGVALFSDHTTSYLQQEDLPLGLTVQYTGKALWGRDYRLHGPTRIRYALLPHAGDWEEGLVQRESDIWNEPLQVRFVEKPIHPARNLIEITGDNLELSSVVVEDGALIVRLYNSSSDTSPREIRWNVEMESIEQIDLNGNKTGDLSGRKMANGQLSTVISIPQFGFVTLKIKGIRPF